MTVMDEEPVYTEVTVTCTTPGCMNGGIPITLLVPPGGDIFCGPCGAQLTPGS